MFTRETIGEVNNFIIDRDRLTLAALSRVKHMLFTGGFAALLGTIDTSVITGLPSTGTGSVRRFNYSIPSRRGVTRL